MEYYISKKGEKIPIEKAKILIAVKTYPLPSNEYQELVCTAGIKEDGSWIRLYPVPFRYLPFGQQYKKWDWIETNIAKHEGDVRAESYRPCGNINIVGHIDTNKNWEDRKKYILRNVESSIGSLKEKAKKGISIVVVRPKEITDFIIEDASEEWKDKWQTVFRQGKLFGTNQKPLEKIPFKFSYKFICSDKQCGGHKIMIEDWEIYELYRGLFSKYGKDVALEKVKDKYFNVFAKNNDIYFFMGTTKKDHHRGTFVIIGLFYPKKTAEMSCK